jgi:DNA topoisomerase-2
VITELPIGKWTNDYKGHLLKMQSKGEIDSFVENHTTNSVSFIVTLKSVQLTRMMKTGLVKAFRLQSNMPLTNMNAFDPNTRIQKYSSPEDVINDYFPVRLGLYHDRKEALECSMEYSAALIRNKAIFIQNVVDGNIDLVRGNKSKQDAVHQLEELQFAKLQDLENILTRSKASTKLNVDSKNSNTTNIVIQQDGEHENDLSSQVEESKDLKQYDYLLNMPLSSLTFERINALGAEAQKTQKELDLIRNTTPEELWDADLNKLDEYLSKKMKH